MKKLLASLLVIMMVVTSGIVNTFAQIPSNKIMINEFEWEVLRLVNIERAKVGRDSLSLIEPLQKACDVRENELKTHYSHTRPDGSKCQTVVPQDFEYRAFGENIAQGQKTPKQVMNDWMNSEGHRANILSEKYGYIGIGFSENNWVQLFANRNEISSCTVSSPTTEFKDEKSFADEYLTCETSDGYTSYLPLDINSMKKSQEKLTPMLPINNLPLFTIGGGGSNENISNPLDIQLPTPKGDEKYKNSDNAFNVTGNQAISMLSNAKSGKSKKPFLLIYYSRHCNICAGMMPSIIETTKKNNLQLYMLDNANTYDDGTASGVLNYCVGSGNGAVPFPVIFYYDGNKLVSQELSKPKPLPDNYKKFLIANNIITDSEKEPVITPEPEPKPEPKPQPKPEPSEDIGLTLSETEVVIPLNGSVNITAEANQKINWRSSSLCYLIISRTLDGKSATLYGIAPTNWNKAVATATTQDGKHTKSIKVTITDRPAEAVPNKHIGGVILSYACYPVVGGVYRPQVFAISPSDGDKSTVKFSSSDPEIATVDSDGTLHAHKSGEFDVVYTHSSLNITKKLRIKILEGKPPKPEDPTKPPEPITMKASNSKITLLKGAPPFTGLTPIFSDGINRDYKLSSSDSTILKVVNKYTLVVGKPGKATITITSGDMTATCAITVVEETPKGLTLLSSPTKKNYVVGEKFDPTGFVVAYSDGTKTKKLTEENVKFITSDKVELTKNRAFTTEGTKEVKVTYQGYTVEFIISVAGIQGEIEPEKKEEQEIEQTPVDVFQGSSDWAKAEIKLAKEAGLTFDGILNNYQQNITRAEFCKLVVNFYKAMGGKVPTVGQSPFKDTSDRDILAANKLGIVNGVTSTEFSPNSDTTREEISAMMMRAIKKFDKPNITTDLTKYADCNQISPWAIESLTYLNQEGIIKGMSDTTIAPLNNTSREQAILIVYRTFDFFEFDAGIENGTYKIMTAVNDKNCIGIGGSSKNDGTNAITWESVNIDDQKFKIKKVGDKYSIIAMHSGKALTPNATQKNGTEIVQKTYSGNANQLFDVVDATNGYVSFVSSDGYFLSVSGGNVQKGTKMILWEKTGNTSQKFKLVNVN